ncbi:MAG: antibiotic biosynthesis monooxygenase [Alphaproteobacteria bacterium]|nr:antibiotic biosynthesis monooxygenase [Alphaproteobacteria bacterium]
MLVISGEIKVAPESRAKAVAAMIRVEQATRKETGCLTYTFYADLEDPNCLRIFEEWESDAALAAHFKVPHIAVFRTEMAEVKVLSRQIKKYEVSGSSTL